MTYCCSYKNCFNIHNAGSYLTFFKVPKDSRRDVWLKHSGDIYLVLAPKKKRFFCEVHFYNNDICEYSNRKLLRKNAIPRTYNCNICFCKEGNMDPICKNIIQRINLQPGKPQTSTKLLKRKCETYIPNAALLDSDEDLVVKKSATDKTYSKDYKLPKSPETHEIYEWQFPSPEMSKIPEEKSVLRRIPNYVYAAQKKSNSYIEDHDVIQNLLIEKSEDVNIFVKTQLFHKKSGKWSQKEKQLAIKYYYLSPTLYKHMLKTGFYLPSAQTIIKWHSALRIETGFSDIIADVLKEKFQELDKLNCKSILMMDEMRAKTEVDYNSRDDFIYGFVDLSSLGRKNNISSSAIFFMLRGLNQNWKQTISYVAGPANADELHHILQEDIRKIIHTGCDLVGVTCDQASTNRSCFKKLGVTIQCPYFFIEGKKIYAFYDIPHLFKSVRNCLYSNDIEIEGNIVSWSVIRDVYAFDNGKVKAIFKLTDVHLDPKNFDKMSVKVATQVLSHSVASAILTAVELGCFQNEKKR